MLLFLLLIYHYRGSDLGLTVCLCRQTIDHCAVNRHVFVYDYYYLYIIMLYCYRAVLRAAIA